MTKTTKELNDYEVTSDSEFDLESKWYSEKEVDIIIQRGISTKIDIEHFQKTGMINCAVCHKDFIKIDEYSWKPSCKCFKEDIILSKG